MDTRAVSVNDSVKVEVQMPEALPGDAVVHATSEAGKEQTYTLHLEAEDVVYASELRIVAVPDEQPDIFIYSNTSSVWADAKFIR